jgi:hypothetical protein
VRLERDGAYRVAGDPAKITPNVLLRVILESQGEIASFQEDHGQLSQAFMDLTEPGVAP